MGSLDIAKVRAAFPSLRTGYIYADNAGGSQTAQQVIDNITHYLGNTNVQLGASYSVGVQSTQRVTDGSVAASLLFNAASVDEVGYGPSSTMVFENMARALDDDVHPGDEFIITGEHEANNGPWKRLAQRRGAIVKYWRTVAVDEGNPYSFTYKTEDLVSLVSPKTRIVAITACSNILGSIYPIQDIVRALRQRATQVGARKVEVAVDCVAYAPHRRIDVREWDIDYCVFALYKMYGAHNAAFYIRATALQSSLKSIVHDFLAVNSSQKIQLGGPGYELVHAASGVVSYLLSLTPENNLDATFTAIAQHEQSLLRPLLSFLTDKQQYDRGVRLVGTSTIDLSRVPTVSFVVTGRRAMKSKDIVAEFDKERHIGIRYGHFYAYGLVVNAAPKLDPDDGVVRISLVHYNTVEEVERIVGVLRRVCA
ncbi:pyridoxal phosphate-dependent transferase [Boletus reticuloceps]|uniref:Pyridoxal phosphate-dependent transferase n=1 Tax=Boletus reticuloceps TaxID=495285 RepID=A0A8I2YIS9_9AGAM|nr:pyridoxal phosphate-dependent transferase [Boletus reticuloceps]